MAQSFVNQMKEDKKGTLENKPSNVSTAESLLPNGFLYQ